MAYMTEAQEFAQADYEAVMAEEQYYADQMELDKVEDGVAEYDPEPREDFGWFGEAGLWD